MPYKDAVIAALQRHNVAFFERDETLIIPVPSGDSGFFLIDIHVDEEAGDALLTTGIYRIPKGRREAVALTLAEFGAKHKHIVSSLRENVVFADICVDLDMASDPERTFMLALVRLNGAITHERDRLIAAGRRTRSRRRTRVERELDEILSQAED